MHRFALILPVLFVVASCAAMEGLTEGTSSFQPAYQTTPEGAVIIGHDHTFNYSLAYFPANVRREGNRVTAQIEKVGQNTYSATVYQLECGSKRYRVTQYSADVSMSQKAVLYANPDANTWYEVRGRQGPTQSIYYAFCA
jgi:hypothetical protein